jgi:hypothetical protein
MSDTGEQGVKPQDPADMAGIGGGVVPDDQAEGYEQAEELAQNPDDDSSDDSDEDSNDGSNQDVSESGTDR